MSSITPDVSARGTGSGVQAIASVPTGFPVFIALRFFAGEGILVWGPGPWTATTRNCAT